MLDGGSRWRIALDTDRSWSDGRPLLAQEVADAVVHALARGSSAATHFLSGPDADSGKARPVRVVGADTVEFSFVRPVAFASALLSLPAFAPMRRSSYGHRAPVLGDCAVTHWDAEVVALERRTGSSSHGAFDAMRFEHVPLAADAVRRFHEGDLDATSPTGFGVAEVAELEGHPGAVHKPVEIFGSLDLGRQAPRAWLASAEARRSVSAVLDRNRLGTVTAGLAESWRWPIIDALGAGAPDGFADDSVQRCAALGVDGPLDIAYSAFDPNAEIAEEVAAQLRAALGIEVRTRELSFDAYVRASTTRDFCLLYSLTTPAFSHPAGSLSDWHSTGRAARRSGLRDPVLDTALDAAESCHDPAEADRLWACASNRWCTLLPKIPLVRVRAWYLRGGCLSGLEVSQAGLLRLEAG